jgi:hypothetical protein
MGALRTGLTAQTAADILYALASPQIYPICAPHVTSAAGFMAAPRRLLALPAAEVSRPL